MTMPTGTGRQEHLQRIVPLIRGVVRELSKRTPSSDEVLRTLGTSLSGECIQCGLKVSGEDFVVAADLGQPGSQLNPKQVRLRQGYCARRDCRSYYYQLHFSPVPGINWDEVIRQAENRSTYAAWEESGVVSRGERSQGGSGWGRRSALALVLVLGALFLARQWYVGGRIPLLREPERFEVDLMSGAER